MKKLTISWVGEPKTIETKYGPKQKFSVKAQEEGDKFIDVWVKEGEPLWKTGETHEGDVVPREYNGKTYYDFKVQKFQARNNEDVLKAVADLNNRFTHAALLLVEIGKALNVASLRPKISGTDIDYPTPESQGLKEDDMANFDKEDDGLDQLKDEDINL